MTNQETTIEFQGKCFLLIGDLTHGGTIVTKEQYEQGKCSYAQVYADGMVRRFGQVIGNAAQIKITGRMPFDRFLCARVGLVLLEIALDQTTPRLISHGPTGKPHTCWADTWNESPIFQCGSWQLMVFNDCGDWDHIAGGKTPEGEIFFFESVTHDCFEPASVLNQDEMDAMVNVFKKARRT